MARTIERLSPLGLKELPPGLHPDGAGLYLLVRPPDQRRWVFRYMLAGRTREMGLGPLHTVGLAEARKRAQAARLNRLDGADPIEDRRAQRQARAVAAASTATFKECAEAYIRAHRGAWKSRVHARQWETTLASYAYPVLGALPVAAIEAGQIRKALEPIWLAKPETASRVRGRIERIFAFAISCGYRQGLNPARWQGHMAHLLPARERRVVHHAALPYTGIAEFLLALRGRSGMAAAALEFGILTATRTSEFLLARWSEIDLENRWWLIPAERMKAKRDHRVPLSEAAIAVLRRIGGPADVDEFVFPGATARPLSNMAALMLLRKMGHPDLTVHGFRSTFRDWAAERTNFPAEVAEMALAHTIADKVEAAYRRGDLFDKRRQLMDAWARFCDQPPARGNVTPLRRATIAPAVAGGAHQ